MELTHDKHDGKLDPPISYRGYQIYQAENGHLHMYIEESWAGHLTPAKEGKQSEEDIKVLVDTSIQLILSTNKSKKKKQSISEFLKNLELLEIEAAEAVNAGD
ncbi:hypothetical protein M2146_002519 [Lachnospiraceae bacterium PF1-22]